MPSTIDARKIISGYHLQPHLNHFEGSLPTAILLLRHKTVTQHRLKQPIIKEQTDANTRDHIF